MYHIITAVKPLEGLTLLATFATGEVISFSLEPLIKECPAFEALRDEALFSAVQKDGLGYGVFWNDDLDLSSDAIYSKGIVVDHAAPNMSLVLAEHLQELRHKANLSQRALAKKTGLIQADISKMEQGKGNPTLATLEKLALALNVTVPDLLSLKG